MWSVWHQVITRQHVTEEKQCAWLKLLFVCDADVCFWDRNRIAGKLKCAATTIVPDRLDVEPPAGLTLLTPVALFVTLNPVDKLWLTTFFVWTALMISIVLNIVPSYRKLKICNF